MKNFRTLLMALFVPALCLATTFIERPFPEVVQDSPVIVRGRVGMSYTDWVKGEENSRRIYTFYELLLDEVVKGQGQVPQGLRSIVFRELGGEKDGVGMQVAGSAQFDKGEDVVLLLGNRNSDGSYDLRGLSMAKFNIERDSEGHESLVGAGISSMAPSEGMKVRDVGDAHGHNHAKTDGGRFGMEALRHLVKSQTSEPGTGAGANSVQKQPAKAEGTESTKEVDSNKSPASQLQTSSAGDGAEGSRSTVSLSLLFRVGLAAALLLGLLVWLKRRRS